MEVFLTLKAFKEAAKYNLRYKKLIADADTAVFSKLKKQMNYGIEKADCVEHTLRTLKVHLYTVN
jgi:hypothetical protein